MNSSLVRLTLSKGIALRLLAVVVFATMVLGAAGVAVAQEVPQPAGPSEEYDLDPSPDVVGGPGSEDEYLPYTEDPQPAGPSEEYETGPSNVVGGPGSDEYLPYTEGHAPTLVSATKTASDPFLPFTGADPAIAFGLAGLIAASGATLRRLARRL